MDIANLAEDVSNGKWNEKREELEVALLEAALALRLHVGCDAFRLKADSEVSTPFFLIMTDVDPDQPAEPPKAVH